VKILHEMIKSTCGFCEDQSPHLVGDMRNRYLAAFVSLLLLCVCAESRSAPSTQAVTIDAGANVHISTYNVSAGDVQITIKNLLPAKTTTYELKSDTVTLEVIPPAFASIAAPAAAPPAVPAAPAVVPAEPSACDKQISQLSTKLQAAKDEAVVHDLESEYNALTPTPCASDAEKKSAATALQEFQKSTTTTLDKVTLADGQQEIVTLSRNKNESNNVPAANIGSYTIATPPPTSQWLVLYGVNYILSSDQNFFAKQNSGTPTTYTITAEANRNNHQFAPSIYFMWLPGRNSECSSLEWSCLAVPFAWRGEKSDVFGGLSAGLGFDTSNPIAFLGYGIGWGYNVMFTAGVAVHKENRLIGRYNAGDVVSDNLTSDQLQQQVYEVGAYAGLAFRFGSNPFASSSSKSNASTPASTPNK
jgi:hypothetical protein